MNNPVLPIACELIKITKESQTEWTFRVKTDIKVTHGQFIQLSIPKIGEVPISVSSSGADWLEFTIRAVGKVTDEIFALKPGDTIFLRGPYGNSWPLEQLKGKNIVVIAGGTGFAPVKSLLNYLYDNDTYAASVNLIIGFRNENCIIFKDMVKKFSKKFNTIYTLDNGTAPNFKNGLVTKFIPDIPWKSFKDNYEVIIVGPPIMMHFASLECLKNNVKEEKIWMSFERKMSCAIGKCGHCRIDETYVCLEGPIFNYTKAKELVD